MFGLVVINVLIISLITAIVLAIRSHLKKEQIHRRVLHQIKEENKIWNEILKQKDITKV